MNDAIADSRRAHEQLETTTAELAKMTSIADSREEELEEFLATRSAPSYLNYL
jgi:hypothetical protein